MPDSSDAKKPEESLVAKSLPAHRLSLLVRATGFMLGVLATTVVAMALFISASFSDEQISVDIGDFIVAEYGRALTTTDDIHIALWPWPSLQIGVATLSEPDRPEIFSSWKHASFELDALSLLRHRLVIRHARIDGLTLHLTRDTKGTWNIADLLAPADPETTTERPLSLQLEGLALAHAGLMMEDAISGDKLQWKDVEVTTDALRANRAGRLQVAAQLASPQATLEGKLNITARYQFGGALSTGVLSAGRMNYVGDIGRVKLADFTLDLGSADWQSDGLALADVSIVGAGKLNANPLVWSASLPAANWRSGPQTKLASIDLTLRDKDTQATTGELHVSLLDLITGDKGISTGKLASTWLFQDKTQSAQGKLNAQLHRDDKTAQLSLDQIIGDLSLAHPALNAANTRATLRGNARWLPGRSGLRANGTGNVVRVALNLDAFFGKDALHLTASLAPGDNAGAPVINARLDSKQFDADRLLAKGLPSVALPSGEALRDWTLDGVMHVENLRLSGMLMTSLNVPVKVADGKLSLPEHEIALYGGKLAGNIAYDPAGPTLTAFETLREVQLTDLTRDAKIGLPLTGLTNATLDIRSQGSDWQENANGVLRVYSKNARWLGVDLPRGMLSLHAGQTPQDDAKSSTPLTELTAAFTVKGPDLVATKLTARSDAVTLTGSGNIQYALREMDLALTARVGNDKALAVLRGQSMPLIAKGPLMQPRLQIAASGRETVRAPDRTPQSTASTVAKP